MDIYLFFQLWLILSGIIPKPWTHSDTFILQDWYGNKISLPTTSTLSLVFSVLNMLKAAVSFNVLRVHTKVSKCRIGGSKLLQKCKYEILCSIYITWSILYFPIGRDQCWSILGLYGQSLWSFAILSCHSIFSYFCNDYMSHLHQYLGRISNLNILDE